MCWCRALALLILSGPAFALDGYILSAGVDTDSEDGLAATVAAELGLAEETWLSVALASNQTDLPFGNSVDTLLADVGIDHWFDPLGIRAGVSYWGDNEILDSIDFRGSMYWRGDSFNIAANLERREFTFDIFRQIVNDGRDFEFHANGLGLSARLELSEAVDVSFAAMDYDYSINLDSAANRPIADVLSISRLSLLSSLSDYQGRVGIDIEVGQKLWTLDYARSKGAVDGRTTDSITLRFLAPMGDSSDIEFSLGVDQSEDFDSVTLFSVFLYFYG